MLRVVVENLLANAIRYAGLGSTCSLISVSNAVAATPALAVSLDDGAGVDALDLPVACSSGSTAPDTQPARLAAPGSASRS